QETGSGKENLQLDNFSPPRFVCQGIRNSLMVTPEHIGLSSPDSVQFCAAQAVSLWKSRCGDQLLTVYPEQSQISRSGTRHLQRENYRYIEALQHCQGAVQGGESKLVLSCQILQIGTSKTAARVR